MAKDGTPDQPKYNKEQYEMLRRCSEKKDISEWNNWRSENPTEDIMLQGAHLHEFHLAGANLAGANLEGAILETAKLAGVCFQGAVLKSARLKGADLQLAYLEGANLENAHLEEVHLRKAYLNGAYLKCASFEKANLENTDLYGTYLEMANLKEAILKRADLRGAILENAHLEGACLRWAHLEGANLMYAYLQRADLSLTHLQSANLSYAIVNGETVILGCDVNKWNREKSRFKRYTDFEGVSLDSARIDSGFKQLLEYNIRRNNWQKKYRYHKPKSNHGRFLNLIHYLMAILNWFGNNLIVRPFWWLSDYGFSTIRIVISFGIFALLFAVLYSVCAWMWPPGLVKGLHVEPHTPLWHYLLLLIIRPVYFSIVTMTTLGFGDMYANSRSLCGHLLLIFQVLLGYLMLAALVTRLAILFTAGGPAGKFTPMSEHAKQKLKKLKELEKPERLMRLPWEKWKEDWELYLKRRERLSNRKIR